MGICTLSLRKVLGLTIRLLGLIEITKKVQIYIVVSVLVFLCSVIFSLPSFPTVDGGAHLYNSLIASDILLGKVSPYSDYFCFNSLLVPNGLDHLVFGLLGLFLPILWVQKVVVCLAIIIQFWLLYSLNPSKALWVLLVLPIVFSSFLFIGLYNQYFSFIIFLAYIVWLEKRAYSIPCTMQNAGWVLLYSLLFWSTSILGYALFLLLTALVILGRTSRDKWPKNILGYFIVVLPTLSASLFFVNEVTLTNREPIIDGCSRFASLLNLQAVRLFGLGGEHFLLILVGISLSVLLIVALKSTKNKNVLKLIFLALLFLCVTWVPNEVGAGMLTNRLSMYFWVLALTVIIKNTPFSRFSICLLSVLFCCTALVLNKRYHGGIKQHARIDQELIEIGSSIKSGSTVWSVNFSEDWYFGHSFNIACAANKSICIENYEANYSWFPISWKDSITMKRGKVYKTAWENDRLLSYVDVYEDYLLTYGTVSQDYILKVLPYYKKIKNTNNLQLYQRKPSQ